MKEFLTTSSNPPGHGFTQHNLGDDFACYSFEPKSNIPIKVIVLDDTQKDEAYEIREHDYLDNKHDEFIIIV